jgi:hypothetical protein
MTRSNWFRRSVTVVVAALGFAACSTVDDLLEANNPEEIREDQLDDETLATVLANSVLARMTEEYSDDIIWVGSLPTDEQVSGINWPDTKDLGKRLLPYDASDANGMYRALQRLRFMGDSISSRLRNLLPNPNADRRMALVLAHAGYAYTFMAEYLCEATINVGATRFTPQQLADTAMARFDAAIAVATAAGAGANDVRNLALVGLARAATAANNKPRVMAAAAQVPSNFIWWVEYKNNVVNNSMQGNVTGGNHNLSVHPRFLSAFGTYGQTIPVTAQTDPRIQFMAAPRLGHDAATQLYTPFQPLAYSGYTGTLQTGPVGTRPILFTNDTDIRLASYLDAMHNYYEAAGPTGTGPEGTTLQFVNARRAVGNQPAVNLSGAALMAELREQRGRDLFLGGFRVGDLRRWKAQGVGDFWPSGPHPNPTMGTYGTMECFPIPLAEYVGNPNITR